MNGHPSWEQLIDLVEERLAPADGASVAAHVEGCRSCHGDLEWLQHTLPLLDGTRFVAPPAEARERVLNAFERRGAPRAQELPAPLLRPTPPPRRNALPTLAAFAALAALILLALLVWQGREPEVLIAAMVQQASGTVQVGSDTVEPAPVVSQQPLQEGDEVSTGPDGEATLTFANESVRVQLYPESTLRVEGLGDSEERDEQVVVRCQRGKMRTSVRQSTGLLMHAYGNQLSTTNATFELDYRDDHSTAVQIEEGSLHIQNEAGEATFTEGEEVLLWFQTAPGDLLEFPLRYPNEQGALLRNRYP